MNSRRPRWGAMLIVVALAAAVIVALASVREPLLRAAGRMAFGGVCRRDRGDAQRRNAQGGEQRGQPRG